MSQENARKQLARILAGSFRLGDFFITLGLDDVPTTADGEQDKEKFKKILADYTRRLRALYREAGTGFRFVYTIKTANDHGPFRMYAEMMIPKLNCDVMSEWKSGRCRIMIFKGDCRLLASFMLDDPTMEKSHQKSWCASKNVISGGM